MRAAAAVGAVALALVLSSCAVGSAYPAFDRAATDEDQLPEVFFQSEFDGYNSSFATRFAGSLADRDYFLTASGPGYTAELAAAPLEERDGWTIVGDNIRVLDEAE